MMSHIGFVSLMISTAIVVLPVDCISTSNLGRKFYLASMPLYNDPSEPLPLLLKIISNSAGTVQVIIPALNINTTYSLTPKLTEISISGLGIRADSIGIDNKGIQITSTVEVSIYVVEGATWGGYGKVMPVVPVISSAQVFVVQSYKTVWDSRKSHFIVIATEDSTDVKITLKTTSPGNLTYRNTIFKDGDVIHITLNQLQTFYAYLFANDMSGSLIESNKPVTVLSGADCVDIPKDAGGGCNMIESQMTPVSQWGRLYIVPPLHQARCHVRLFAYYNDSQISVSAEFYFETNVTLNKGEFWETTIYSSQAQPIIISSNKDVNVVLYGASAGESDGHKSNPFMLVVPEVNQYSTSTAPFPTLTYGESLKNERLFQNFATIVLKKTSIYQLHYNGISPQIIQNYSVLNDYSVVVIALKNVTTHTISTVNTSTPIPMAVLVYGMARFESYGFVAGFKFINTDCDDLIAPLFGSLSSKRVSHGNIVTVSCNKGYTLLGERTIACTSGSLSSSIGTCEAGCNDLEAPIHGSLSTSNLSHGNHLTISCNHGFTLSGERTLICLSGSLSSNIGSCESDCDGLMAPDHGSLSSKVASHGNHVTVSCDPSYILSGENILVCSSGSWSGTEGACVKDEGPTVEGSSPVSSIIVGALLGSIIIVLLSIIVVMCIQNKRKAVKDTSATRQTLDQVQVNETEIGNNPGYTSLNNDGSDSSTYATLNVSEAPYLTPVSLHNVHYNNGNI